MLLNLAIMLQISFEHSVVFYHLNDDEHFCLLQELWK